jgi:uncharacterized protein (TIGR00730 family)
MPVRSNQAAAERQGSGRDLTGLAALWPPVVSGLTDAPIRAGEPLRQHGRNIQLTLLPIGPKKSLDRSIVLLDPARRPSPNPEPESIDRRAHPSKALVYLMPLIKSLCVYCGSGRGKSPSYVAAAQELGEALAERKIRLIYGGARIGIMGEAADAAIRNGGEVIGIIPAHLQDTEVGHSGITELKVVDSMHTRKKLMFDMSDAFAVLPGGFGTLDELFEIITWRMLSLHDKPIVIVNVDGYWNGFQDLVDRVIGEGFARETARQHFSVVNSVGRLFDLLAAPAETAEADHPERM